MRSLLLVALFALTVGATGRPAGAPPESTTYVIVVTIEGPAEYETDRWEIENSLTERLTGRAAGTFAVDVAPDADSARAACLPLPVCDVVEVLERRTGLDYGVQMGVLVTPVTHQGRRHKPRWIPAPPELCNVDVDRPHNREFCRDTYHELYAAAIMQHDTQDHQRAGVQP